MENILHSAENSNDSEKINLRKLIWVNRQPTLWSHSCPAVEVIPRDDEESIFGIAPLFIEPLNMDFDGDTAAVYVNHDEEALKQIYEKAALRNTVFYDAQDNFLSTIRHEALYSAYILSKHPEPKTSFLAINSLYELPEEINFFNDNIHSGVSFDGKLYTYGICLLNKWCGFDKIYINELITKKQVQKISRTIFEVHDRDPKKFYDNLFELEKKLMFFITIVNAMPTLSLNEMSGVVDDKSHELIRKLPNGNPFLTYHLNNALIDRCVENFDHDTDLYNLFKSGSRFSKTQLARSCISIGLLADQNNVVDPNPICSSLIEGLTPEEFFQSSPGTRKGLIDKEKSVPESGYLERTLTMALSSCEIIEEDCQCESGLEIKVLSEAHLRALSGKYWNEGFYGEEWKILNGNEKELIGERITIRSPMTCQTPNFRICRKCFGARRTRTPYVGVTAGQVATERLTQLLMRSFHTSGSCILSLDQDVSRFIQNHLLDIQTENNNYKLIFSLSEIPPGFKDIPGFVSHEGNEVIFTSINEIVHNNDTIAVVERVKNILRKDDSPTKTPSEYYQDLMECILDVGESYSSYIELILTHIFMVDDNTFWRYAQDRPIKKKLSDKTIAVKISPLLGFLYQPNKQSIQGVTDEHLLKEIPDDEMLSFFEKIFLHKF